MNLVSFCISTFKRPQLLRIQLERLSQQTFSDFEVVVSDNDPLHSGQEIVAEFDSRFRYYANAENLGMMRSFNLSIERSNAEFIVTVTDDDPIDNDFLEDMVDLMRLYPGKSMYAGCIRANSETGAVEEIAPNSIIAELLLPEKTLNFIWSSCLLKKEDVIKSGLIPEFGSPHLADHAFLALVARQNGAILKNRLYSQLNFHDQNFSKLNLGYYFTGCLGFHDCMVRSGVMDDPHIKKAVLKHLHHWFIVNSFTLKKYYTIHNNTDKLKEIDLFAEQIMGLAFMHAVRFKYVMKNFIFKIKRIFWRMRASKAQNY